MFLALHLILRLRVHAFARRTLFRELIGRSPCVCSRWQSFFPGHTLETRLLHPLRSPQRSLCRYTSAGSLSSSCSLGRCLKRGKNNWDCNSLVCEIICHKSHNFTILNPCFGPWLCLAVIKLSLVYCPFIMSSLNLTQQIKYRPVYVSLNGLLLCKTPTMQHTSSRKPPLAECWIWSSMKITSKSSCSFVKQPQWICASI